MVETMAKPKYPEGKNVTVTFDGDQVTFYWPPGSLPERTLTAEKTAQLLAKRLREAFR